MEPEFDEMTDFEKWFYGSTAYADGDLAKYSNGEYIRAMTKEFFNCWNAALETSVRNYR